MPSTRFSQFKLNIDELRRLLLPIEFDPTGTYTDADRVTACTLFFRVLSHAEVEAYLEDRVLEIATTAKQAWENQRFVSVVSFHLIGFSGMATDKPPETLSTSDPKKAKHWVSRTAIDDRFSKCVSEFHKRVRLENHGIKEKNILEMFIPIGFNMSKCDPLFLQTLTNFGEIKGTSRSFLFR